jgi:hypothetical protein
MSATPRARSLRRAWQGRLPALAVLTAVLFAGGLRCTSARHAVPDNAAAPGTLRKLTFHGDPARTGWNPYEIALSPARVSGGSFGALWSSPPFDAVTIDGKSYAPHVYATPLYLENAPPQSTGPFAGCAFDLVYAATTNAFVYSVVATSASCNGQAVDRGTIVWRSGIGTAAVAPALDGGIPVGVLSTPFIDLSASRIYVASMDKQAGWQIFALDLATGGVLPGWPVRVGDDVTSPINKNGKALFNPDPRAVSQRSALNLSADGSRLYVPFAGYYDGAVGWMVAVDTRAPKVAAAFSSAPSMANAANGGIWGPGGASVDTDGRVYATTGNSPVGSLDAPGVWGQSLLAWSPELDLVGTYTPFNYCAMDRYDTDLAGSSAILLPQLDAASTSTPSLMAFAGKQGNVYLVDRAHIPGRLDHRQGCNEAALDSSSDLSLLPPDPQPQFGRRGPLNAFGPYTEDFANLNFARMRTTPAYFRDAAGTSYLFVSGATKQRDPTGQLTETSIPPCVVRLRLVTQSGAPAYLVSDRVELTVAFVNPGSPVVSSNGSRDSVVWIIDENAKRTDKLVADDPSTLPHPVLHAFDGDTLAPLWRSGPNDLDVGGKYGTVTVVRGVVIVGTDRIQAFGLRP